MRCKQSETVPPVHCSELLNLRLPRVTSSAPDTDPNLPSGGLGRREGKKVGWRVEKEEVGDGRFKVS